MIRYIVSFIFLIAGIIPAYADNIATEKSNQSTVAITIGVIIICCIFFMLIGRQKRRFND